MNELNIKKPMNIKNELMPRQNGFVEVNKSLGIDSKISITSDHGNSNVAVYYISDLHIDHKIKVDANTNYNNINYEIKKIVDELVKSTIECNRFCDGFSLLIIAGDVSSNIMVTKEFYRELSNVWDPKRIIAILGNHELWGFNNKKAKEIIRKYRDFFEKQNITFLHNDLLIVKGSIRHNDSIEIIKEKEILDFYKHVKPENQKILFRNSSYVILGGTGFAGLSNEFNANNGIYGNAITSKEQEKIETQKYSKIYDILLKIIPENKVVVLTHMPMHDWSNKHYNPNWIYVSGHTHHNNFINSENAVVFSDNQLGYDSTQYELKMFPLSTHYDYFSTYKEGIYEITYDDYNKFCRGKGLTGSIRRSGQIYMVKRSNLYCFFFKWENTNKIYLLNGGNLNSIEHQDLTYYYNNIGKYAKMLKKATASRQKALNSISNIVKLIGGDGRIHGSIVDIDFHNHIYLNLFDGTITPYFATSVVDRLDYPSVSALLAERRPDLHQKLLNHEFSLKLIGGDVETAIIEQMPTENSDTSMYGYSLKMKSIQALLNENVIRIWNEDLLQETIEGTKKQLVEEINIDEL